MLACRPFCDDKLLNTSVDWNFTPVWCMHVLSVWITEENSILLSLVAQNVQPTQKRQILRTVKHKLNWELVTPASLTHACIVNSKVFCPQSKNRNLGSIDIDGTTLNMRHLGGWSRTDDMLKMRMRRVLNEVFSPNEIAECNRAVCCTIIGGNFAKWREDCWPRKGISCLCFA